MVLAENIYPLLLEMRYFQLFWSSRGAWRSVFPDLADSATLLTLEDLNVQRESSAKLFWVVSVCSVVFSISWVVFCCPSLLHLVFWCFSLASRNIIWSLRGASSRGAVPHTRHGFSDWHIRPHFPVEWYPLEYLEVVAGFSNIFPGSELPFICVNFICLSHKCGRSTVFIMFSTLMVTLSSSSGIRNGGWKKSWLIFDSIFTSYLVRRSMLVEK